MPRALVPHLILMTQDASLPFALCWITMDTSQRPPYLLRGMVGDLPSKASEGQPAELRDQSKSCQETNVPALLTYRHGTLLANLPKVGRYLSTLRSFHQHLFHLMSRLHLVSVAVFPHISHLFDAGHFAPQQVILCRIVTSQAGLSFLSAKPQHWPFSPLQLLHRCCC